VSVLVTGAGSGIGAAVARELSSRGLRVAVTDLDPDAARAVAGRCNGAAAFGLDVTDRASIEQATDAAVAELGPLEAWVSNAGVSSMAPFVELDEASIDLNFAVNSKGPLLCGQVAARHLISGGKGGAIVNVASMAGKRGGVPYLAHYVASKFAVVGLTQAMAHELAPRGIRVNCVCPGYVATGMQERELRWEAALRGTGEDEVRELYVADTPLGRLETPEDVARAVAFLVSADAAFITGEALAVNGGAHMD
jgi:meso-butanediol dehydrogenase / (S,S)-butanediol dehydrogenase / diacetyl reductase